MPPTTAKLASVLACGALLAACTIFLIPYELRQAIAGAEAAAAACGATAEQIEAAWAVYAPFVPNVDDHGEFIAADSVDGEPVDIDPEHPRVPDDANRLFGYAERAALRIAARPPDAARAAAEFARVRFYAETARFWQEWGDITYESRADPGWSGDVLYSDALRARLPLLRAAFERIARALGIAESLNGSEYAGRRSRITGALVAAGYAPDEAAHAAAAAGSIDALDATIAALAGIVDAEDALRVAELLQGGGPDAGPLSASEIEARIGDEDAARAAIVGVLAGEVDAADQAVVIERFLRDFGGLANRGLGRADAQRLLEGGLASALVDEVGIPDRRAAGIAQRAVRAAVEALSARGRTLLDGPDAAHLEYRRLVGIAAAALDGDAAAAEIAVRARIGATARTRASVAEAVLDERESGLRRVDAENLDLAQQAYDEYARHTFDPDASGDAFADAAGAIVERCLEDLPTNEDGKRDKPAADACTALRERAVALLESIHQRRLGSRHEAVVAALEDAHLTPRTEAEWQAWREDARPEAEHIARIAAGIERLPIHDVPYTEYESRLRGPLEEGVAALEGTIAEIQQSGWATWRTGTLTAATVYLGVYERDPNRSWWYPPGAADWESDDVERYGLGALQCLCFADKPRESAKFRSARDANQLVGDDALPCVVDLTRNALDRVRSLLEATERDMRSKEGEIQERAVEQQRGIRQLAEAAFAHYPDVCPSAQGPAVQLVEVTPRGGLNPFDPTNPLGAPPAAAGGGSGGSGGPVALGDYAGEYGLTFVCVGPCGFVAEAYDLIPTLDVEFIGSPPTEVRIFDAQATPFVAVRGPFVVSGSDVLVGPLTGAGTISGIPFAVQASGRLFGAPGAPRFDLQYQVTSGLPPETLQMSGS